MSQLVVNFSEELLSGLAGTNSVLNLSNWTLTRNGAEVIGGISGVFFSLNPATHKYEAVVTFDDNGGDPGIPPLSDGEYTLTIRDSVSDLAGNALDGNYDGMPGGDFSRSFAVLDPLSHWHWRNPRPNDNILYGVAFGEGLFVAVGDKGTILTSSGGTNWISRNSGTDKALSGVTYANGIFV